MFSYLEEIKKKIEKEIESDTQLDKESKSIWKSVFFGLAEYQQKKLDEIYDKIDEKSIYEKKTEEWNIYTGLVKKDINLEGTGFDYILDEDRESLCVCCKDGKIIKKKNVDDTVVIEKAYLAVELSELLQLTGYEKQYIGEMKRNGKEMEFSYSLVLHDDFLEEEKKLYDIAELYQIDRPVIFAPMFRRYVYIETKEVESGDIIESLQLEKNHLQNKLLLDYRSVWNFTIEGFEPKPYYEYEKDSVIYKALLKQGGYLYLPDSNRFDCCIEETKEGFIEISFSKYDYDAIKMYKIHSITENKSFTEIMKFKNYEIATEKDTLPIKIKSQADIDNILSKLPKSMGLTVESMDIQYKDTMECLQYPSFLQYKKREDQYLKFNQKTIYLHFAVSKEPYTCDKIIYFISYMNQHYPEFTWEGLY